MQHARSSRGFVTAWLLCLAGLQAGADDPAPAAPGATPTAVAEARAAADSPALGWVVMRDGEKPVVAVDGVRVAGESRSVTAADRWHWGSITKSMTATLVARLVEREVVSWDDTVHSRLGRQVPEMHEAYRQVTFRHLLTHRAGLQANIPVERFADFPQTAEDPIADRLRWVQIALTQAPVGPREETYLYSNNGYIVAGAMLESATTESWETLMRREVFEPLRLDGAGFGAPGKGQPRGHRPDGGADRPAPIGADNPAALGPAGRVHMPLADMARYLSAHARREDGFLQKPTWDVLHTPIFGGNYAMGWIAVSPESRWHNGSNTMWYAEAVFDVESGTVAAIVVNDGDIAAVQPVLRARLRRLMTEAPAAESGDGTGR